MIQRSIDDRTIARQVLAIALPAIVSNLTTPLLSLVDLAIVGHLGSPVFIAAIALGGTVFSSIYWLFAFLRMGTSGTVAQAYGAKDQHSISENFYRPMLIASALGIVLIAANGPLGDFVIGIMSDDDSAMVYAREYFDVLIYGAPATLVFYVINGYLIGTQNSRFAMWLSFIINISNIAASLIAVYLFGLGIKGVALGTLVSQWIGVTVGFSYIFFHDKPLRVRLKALFNLHGMSRYFSINFDIFLRTLCLVAVTVWFTRSGAKQGDVMLSVNALLMQLFIMFSYFMDGFAYSAEALVGKFTGAKDQKSVDESIKWIIKICSVIAAVFTVTYLFFGKNILALLTSEPEVLSVSNDYLIWSAAIPATSFLAFIFDGAFIGMTHSRWMLYTVGIGMIVFFAIYFAAFNALGNHGLWIAFISYLLTRSIASLVLYRGGLNRDSRV